MKAANVCAARHICLSDSQFKLSPFSVTSPQTGLLVHKGHRSLTPDPLAAAGPVPAEEDVGPWHQLI